jgi:hypothetical protein
MVEQDEKDWENRLVLGYSAESRRRLRRARFNLGVRAFRSGSEHLIPVKMDPTRRSLVDVFSTCGISRRVSNHAM